MTGKKAAIGPTDDRPLSKCKLGLALTTIALASSNACAQVQDLPGDAMKMCTVDQAIFASWFGGTVTTDAPATPADSRNDLISNCDFHQWAERMFLWLTSQGDNGRRVFHSSDFYTVSPPMADTRRTMTRNKDQQVRFDLLTSKPAKIGQAGNGDVLMATTIP